MENPSIKTGYSLQKDPRLAVDEVYSQIKQDNTKLIIYFVPAPYDQQVINDEFRKKIPLKVPFLGCSSLIVKLPRMRMVNNITPRGLKEAIVAMSIASDDIRASVRLMKNIKENWKEESKKALIEASKDLGIDPKNTDPQRYFGILLCDAMAEREEYILENLYARSNFLFVGGGASGKYNIFLGVKPGYIHTREGIFINSAAIAVVKTSIPFKIEMSTSLVPTDIKIKITKAKGRRVFKINGNPAAKEYARLISVPRFLLGKKGLGNYWKFTDNPFGILLNEKAFIRTVVWPEGESLIIATNVREGEELYLMKRTDIVKTTKKTIKKIERNLGEISGILAFNCAYRDLEIFREGKIEDFSKIFDKFKIIGLNSYGEYYGWTSLAQTLTVLAFGKK